MPARTTLLKQEAAYHAQSQQEAIPDTNTALSVLAIATFRDEAKLVATIRHAMDVVRSAVEKFNPNQVPIIACDQPLYVQTDTVELAF